MPLFHVGFEQILSCSIFHVASCRIDVCDARDVEIHGLESNRTPYILLRFWDSAKYVVSCRVVVSCLVCGCPTLLRAMELLESQNMLRGAMPPPIPSPFSFLGD